MALEREQARCQGINVGGPLLRQIKTTLCCEWFRMRQFVASVDRVSKTAWVGIGAVTVGTAFAAALDLRWRTAVGREALANYGLLVFAIFAAVCGGLAARSAQGRQRIAWICLTVGLTGWALGSALLIYYENVLHQSPFPSLADVGYLLFPIGA